MSQKSQSTRSMQTGILVLELSRIIEMLFKELCFVGCLVVAKIEQRFLSVVTEMYIPRRSILTLPCDPRVPLAPYY